MHSTSLVTLAIAALSQALPQTPPAATTPPAKAPSAPKGLSPPKVPVQGKTGSGGLDLRPLADALSNPAYPKALPAALSLLEPLWKVPELPKYAPAYLDWRNTSNVPFIVAMDAGPAPDACTPYEILIARGTGELGPYGFIVGDPLLKEVQKTLPGVQGYSVAYPANIGGNSSRVGAADVVARLQKQSAKCPEQKFAVVGYSQGGMVMRSALSDVTKINEKWFKQIVGGAMFGAGRPTGVGSSANAANPTSMGPWRTAGFAGGLEERIMNRCAKGDPACGGGSNIIGHLTYNSPDTGHIPESAAWIIARFKGEPLPAAAKTT